MQVWLYASSVNSRLRQNIEIYSNPSFIAGVTFRKWPAISEIREIENFIFFLQLATITCIQIQWLTCRPFHCSSDWAAASWLRSAVFSSSEARGAGVFVPEKNIVIGSCCRSFFFFAKRSLYTDMPPSITLENCNERLIKGSHSSATRLSSVAIRTMVAKRPSVSPTWPT